jgi:hypothetical protein
MTEHSWKYIASPMGPLVTAKKRKHEENNHERMVAQRTIAKRKMAPSWETTRPACGTLTSTYARPLPALPTPRCPGSRSVPACVRIHCYWQQKTAVALTKSSWHSHPPSTCSQQSARHKTNPEMAMSCEASEATTDGLSRSVRKVNDGCP